MEEEVERRQEPAVIDASKETTLSRHNRADAHINLQRPALVQAGQKSHPRQGKVPPLTTKLFVIVVFWEGKSQLHPLEKH